MKIKKYKNETNNIKLLFALIFVSLYSYGQELIPTQCPSGAGNNKSGFKDKTTDEVVICNYYKVWNFDKELEGLAKVQKNITPNNQGATLRYGFIDKTGKEIISVKYDEISPFSENINCLAKVKLYGKYGFINKEGKEVIAVRYSNSEFQFNEGLAAVKCGGLYGFIDKTGKEIIPCKYNYAGTFINGLAPVKNDKDKDGYTDVAGTFYKGSIDNAIRIVAEKKARGDYKAILAHIQQAEQQMLPEQKLLPEQKQKDEKTVKKYCNSDVDVDLPEVSGKENSNTFAWVIANENYQHVDDVEFALNDGETFKEYCIKILKLPEENVKFFENATLNNIASAIRQIKGIDGATEEKKNIIFYYAGHAIPDEQAKSAYLLPTDGYGTDVESCYKIDKLYSELSTLSAKSVTIFMDACFSGIQRSGDMVVKGRGVARAVQPGKPSGNIVVFSAATGDQTALPYRDKGHGMFTYFLLKKLKETQGAVTFGELDDYIRNNVSLKSISINNKPQTPTVVPATSMEDKWRTMKLK